MSESLFGLSGEDYWRDPWKNASSVMEKYVFSEKWGIYIDAPAEVDLSEHDTVPMALLWGAAQKDTAGIRFDKMAKLVVVHLGDRSVYVGRAVAPTDREREDDFEPPPDAPFPTSQTHTTDLMSYGGLNRGPGRYLVTVLMRDKMSNRVLVVLKRGPKGYQDPEVPKFLDRKRAEMGIPPVEPVSPAQGDPLPSYLPLEGSPPIPEKEGLAISVERVVLASEGARGVLKGSFRIAALQTELVPPPPPPEPGRGAEPGAKGPSAGGAAPGRATPGAAATGSNGGGPRRTDPYGTPRPTAIVPITLVVLGTTDLGEKVQTLRVPSYDPIDPATPNPVVTGHFAIDLFADPSFRLAVPAQTNFIYAFCGEAVSGPNVMAVVTPDMLRKP